MTTAHLAAEAGRSPRVRTQNFVPTPSPLRAPADGYRASPPHDGSPTERTPYIASLSLGSALHLRLPPDPPSRARHTPQVAGAPAGALVTSVGGSLRQGPQRTWLSSCRT